MFLEKFSMNKSIHIYNCENRNVNRLKQLKRLIKMQLLKKIKNWA
jgi:hypothetical protein